MTCGEKLLELTGRAQLLALGLMPSLWEERFRRDLLLSALIHDIGKANSYFQRMLERLGMVVQPIRHEAVSYWIARRPAMRSWLHGAIGDPTTLELVLWAVAGHHRKFPPGSVGDEPMEVYLGHDDFRETLDWGAAHLGLPDPPKLEDATIRFTPPRDSVFQDFVSAQSEAATLMRTLKRQRPEEARSIALLQSLLDRCRCRRLDSAPQRSYDGRMDGRGVRECSERGRS